MLLLLLGWGFGEAAETPGPSRIGGHPDMIAPRDGLIFARQVDLMDGGPVPGVGNRTPHLIPSRKPDLF